jgi:type II secretory pathway component PulK
MKTDPGNRKGFALLMVILLLALLSGVVVQSLISARMSLRACDERQIRLTLRAAALDASWAAMRNGMKAGTASSEYQVFESRTPTGIQSRTTLQGLQREALPPPLQRRDVPIFGQYFAVTTQSASGTRSGLSRGLACRLPAGTIRLLAWVEHP